MTARRLVVISDFQDGHSSEDHLPDVDAYRCQWSGGARGEEPRRIGHPDEIVVYGGYLERLPLAAIKAGLVDCAEIWTHWRGENPPHSWTTVSPYLTRRAFRMNGPDAPINSNDMLGHIEAFGAPDVLCVWGLGVHEDILAACTPSFKIYNSIDAPALRIPPNVSRHFDLVLTGADWQSQEVKARHPKMQTSVMPIGPEFASDVTFHPLDLPKAYDIIYVAAAQAYKRHDVLFNALAKLPTTLRTVCVCGYGEMADDLRRQAFELNIHVDFIGPPGVPFEEVNRLMNQSRIGVVCGVDDGAPAIITEYMLAGIPVLANSALRCGLQYISDATGRTASEDDFHLGILDLLDRCEALSPRDHVLQHWTWPHTIKRFAQLTNNFRKFE
ncbi:glycosyltransferase family 4 protein [Agrobacterium larrymoorei]|uniref:glycosyltransferase n=1 Tax=Agrobacterium larrymoorei TaxID=160699 RepID=UPI00157181E3|nr:glycosyltransferase [Agrobacterium larrymoorei]NTJ43896.1 glycosyltransferase family 4 protein [Agrobacterium larrymoorei]